jgi:hypothetical protein
VRPHLRWARCSADPSTYDHRDAADLAINRLDLARMHARTDLDPERLYGLNDRLRASDRPSGPVEGREEAVPGRVDLLAAVRASIARTIA